MTKHDHKAISQISQAERYDRAQFQAIYLTGKWLTEAGFSEGMPLKIRVMPDCIVITAQNTRELWGCLEGLSTEPFDADAANQWLNAYPSGLVVTE